MTEADSESRMMSPSWINRVWLIAMATVVGLPAYVIAMLYYGGSPQALTIGYEPVQPVHYSHALHVGQLGMDCRYCHTGVEKGAVAGIPSAETCMACHASVRTKSDKLTLVRESFATGKAIEWVRVHKLPEFAHFDHSAHVTRGIGCASCHGRVDLMERVRQVEPLTMGWCLDCHRNPEPHLRPQEEITNLLWKSDERSSVLGKRLRKQNNINPSTDCSTCHR